MAPPGFGVTVQSIDLWPGGLLHYTMTAQQPAMVAFMTAIGMTAIGMHAIGMPVATVAQVTCSEVTPLRRLAYSHLVDFVPGVAPYHTAFAVEFTADGAACEMRLSFQRMHDTDRSERQRMGWELELGKLAALLAAGAS